jgi:hypothetical protein
MFYIVRFHYHEPLFRGDTELIEEFEYRNPLDAVNHFELFRNDDSDLYKRIELVEVNGYTERLINERRY